MDIPRSCDLSCEGCTRRVIIALRTTLCVSAVVAVLVIIGGVSHLLRTLFTLRIGCLWVNSNQRLLNFIVLCL